MGTSQVRRFYLILFVSEISAEKGLSKDILSHNLDLVLRVLPQDVFGQQQPTPPQDAMFTRHTSVSTMSGSENLSVQAPCEQEFDSTAINDGREELVAGDSHDDVSRCCKGLFLSN